MAQPPGAALEEVDEIPAAADDTLAQVELLTVPEARITRESISVPENQESEGPGTEPSEMAEEAGIAPAHQTPEPTAGMDRRAPERAAPQPAEPGFGPIQWPKEPEEATAEGRESQAAWIQAAEKARAATLGEPASDVETAHEAEALEQEDVVLETPDWEAIEDVLRAVPEEAVSVEADQEGELEIIEAQASEVEAPEMETGTGAPTGETPAHREVREEMAPAPSELVEGDASELMTTLESGTVVHGRYQIVQVLSEDEQKVLYRVRDMRKCPQCGLTDNSPDEAFCASCGAAMDRKPAALMLERPVEQSEKGIEAKVQDHFTEGERCYWVWREKYETTPLGGAEQGMYLVVGQRSDTGRVRELDEDSLLVLTVSCTRESVASQLGLFVVADGMGGHKAGEVASRLAIQTLAKVLVDNVYMPELEGDSLAPDEIEDWLVQAMEAANDRVYLERQKRDNDMGTTLTAALIKDWMLFLAHVGDCRAYRWSEDGLQQLTMDHSIVASMVTAGTAQPDEVYTHPQRSVIYRCVGDCPTVDVDLDTLLLSPGDRLMLCCDGLWEMLRNEGIEDVMLRESDPQTACDILIDQANLAGGMDNISVILVQL